MYHWGHQQGGGVTDKLLPQYTRVKLLLQISTVAFVCLFVCLSFGPDHPLLNHGYQFLIDLWGCTAR